MKLYALLMFLLAAPLLVRVLPEASGDLPETPPASPVASDTPAAKPAAGAEKANAPEPLPTEAPKKDADTSKLPVEPAR